MVAAATNPGSAIGAVVGTARWGALRLVRLCLGSEPAREHHGANRLDSVVDPAALQADLTVIWQADLAFDRPAASMAVREALSAWRAAERSLIAMSAETGDFARAEGEVTILRAAYQRRVEAVRTGLGEDNQPACRSS
jgi:hypothetical protein